jgi:hypothetical protein
MSVVLRISVTKGVFRRDSVLDSIIFDSVSDPDPYVFGPPGSGSGLVIYLYGSRFGSGSGSFRQQAKNEEKP